MTRSPEENMATSAVGAARARLLLRFVPSLSLGAGLLAFLTANIHWRDLLKDPDTFLHLTAGRWMLTHGALPSSDPFSYSMPGAHWIVHEWLSELVLAGVFAGLGWHGLILLTGGCFGLAISLLTRRLLAYGEATTSLLLSLCSLFLLEPHVLARPHLLALLVMVSWCGALVAAREAKRAPPVALLPLMTLWANLHGSFMAGLGLAVFLGTEAALERRAGGRAEARGWIWFSALAALAAVLNPNGVAAFLLPLRFMGMTTLHNSFVEWLSPNFHTFQPLEIWLLGLLAAGFGFGLRLPLLRLLFVLGLLHLALQAGRHGDLVAVLVPLLAWPALGPQLRAKLEGAARGPLTSVFALLAQRSARPSWITAGIIVVGLTARILWTPTTLVNGAATPEAALSRATALALPGRVLNAEGFGGYLIFRGVPVFIDGRIEMYGDDFLARYLRAVQGDEGELTDLLDTYGVAWTLLEPHSGAALILKRLPGWRRVYEDNFAVIDRREPVLSH